MKILRTASGKKSLKISKAEWFRLGRKAGWVKKSQSDMWDTEDDDLMLDESFNDASEFTATGLTYDTDVDVNGRFKHITITYNYSAPGADTEWEPVVEIESIEDMSGQDIKAQVLRENPDYLFDVEEELVMNAEQQIDLGKARNDALTPEEERTPEVDRVPGFEVFDDQTVPIPTDN